MTLDQLVGELQKVVNPRQPVELIAIGIGTDVSKAELTRITQTTGGGVFVATDPAQIGAISTLIDVENVRKQIGGS